MRAYATYTIVMLAFCALSRPSFAQHAGAMTEWSSSDGSKNGAVQFNPTGMSVVVETGSNETVTTNPSSIDQPSTVQCTSAAGCTLTVSAYIAAGETKYGYKVCSLLDGKNLKPLCLDQGIFPYSSISNGMQSALNVAQGSHSVQTEIGYSHFREPFTATIYSWQIVYTLYDH